MAAAAASAVASLKANCRKVVCIGRNYADHIAELSSARPSQPFYFLKPSSSILLPNSGPCIRPRGVKLHYEVELGLVIGPTPGQRPLHNLAEDSQVAMSAIGGWLLALDMTARNVQDEAKRKGLPWSIAKGFDTFLPISHFIAKDQIPDPHAVTLWMDVNGQKRQHESSALMIFQIPRLLSDVSRVMALEEGDIILTGTPKGVGEVKGGDLMTAGLLVDGHELPEAKMEVQVEDAVWLDGVTGYEFRET